MKGYFHLFAILPLLFTSQSVFAAAVGYSPYAFVAGTNLFHNPLGSSYRLSLLFDPSVVPAGTTVSLWNPAANVFDTTSTCSAGVWSPDLELLPDTGARLITSAPFTIVFVE
ncbi:MAG: hypothetical protein WCL11_19570 [Verrucomicrobiota bacterium]